MLSVIGWCSGMSFLSSKHSWASLGVWISELSMSTCCVGLELVHKRWMSGAGDCFLELPVLPGAAGILQGEEGVVNLVALDGLSRHLGGFWLGFLASVKF